jgi:hypothetical protein
VEGGVSDYNPAQDTREGYEVGIAEIRRRKIAAGEIVPWVRREVIGRATVYQGDSREVLLSLPDASVDSCATVDSIVAQRKPPNNLPKRPAKPVPAPAPRPQSVEEWIAIHGVPKRFEPGTLDQILMDTFASVGKELTYSAGAGTSWTPYKLGRKAMNKGQAIAEANNIREAQGKPLLAIPRRPSPSTASRGIKFGSGVAGRVG